MVLGSACFPVRYYRESLDVGSHCTAAVVLVDKFLRAGNEWAAEYQLQALNNATMAAADRPESLLTLYIVLYVEWPVQQAVQNRLTPQPKACATLHMHWQHVIKWMSRTCFLMSPLSHVRVRTSYATGHPFLDFDYEKLAQKKIWFRWVRPHLCAAFWKRFRVKLLIAINVRCLEKQCNYMDWSCNNPCVVWIDILPRAWTVDRLFCDRVLDFLGEKRLAAGPR